MLLCYITSGHMGIRDMGDNLKEAATHKQRPENYKNNFDLSREVSHVGVLYIVFRYLYLLCTCSIMLIPII